jgi:hypothetical protein
MARQSRIIGGSISAYALNRLDRLTKVSRESVRLARAAASIAAAGDYRWQVPAQGLRSKGDHSVDPGSSAKPIVARDGSENGSGATSDRLDDVRARAGQRRTTAMVDAVARAFRKVPELSHRINALSRLERSGDLGRPGRVISDAEKSALTKASNTQPWSRAHGSMEATRQSFANAGVPADVRVVRPIRGVIPPASISQREFVRPSGIGRGSNDNSGRAAITINSSPTVVIGAPVGGALERDVIGALRAHREELFDQLKRESARRERAQF